MEQFAQNYMHIIVFNERFPALITATVLEYIFFIFYVAIRGNKYSTIIKGIGGVTTLFHTFIVLFFFSYEWITRGASSSSAVGVYAIILSIPIIIVCALFFLVKNRVVAPEGVEQ